VFRRRRLGAVVLAAGVVLAAVGLALSPPATGAAPAPVRASASQDSVYTVQPGDTLWSIARGRVASGDIRAEVDRLASLNGSGAIVIGQHLRLTEPPGS